jgi:hypothetical protein
MPIGFIVKHRRIPIVPNIAPKKYLDKEKS